MKKVSSSFLLVISFLIIFFSSSIFLISCSNGERGKEPKKIQEKKTKGTKSSKKTANVLTTEGESSFRISALGGTLEVVDALSPIYGAGVTFPINSYRDNNAPYTRMQWSGGKVERDKSGNPRILVPTGSVDPAFNKGLAGGLLFNILVIYFDSNNDGKIDSFPSFLIKEFKDNKFTTFANLPETGTVKLIQVLEPPEFRIKLPINLSPLKLPAKVKGATGTVVGVGFPVSFSISDTKNSGFLKVGGLPPTEFKKLVTVKIPYSKDAVDALGIDPDKLRLYQLHIDSWRNVTKGLKIDEDKGFVSAKVKEFSIFQVVAPFGKSDSLPIVTDVKIKGEKGKIRIIYNLEDAEGKPSDILIEYRENPNVNPDKGWKTIVEKKNVAPGKKSFRWDSTKDLGGVSGFFQVRVTPTQKIGGKDLTGGRRYSPIFRINNSTTKISPPTKLAGTVDDSKTPPQVHLSWTASSSSEVSGYNVYRQARFDTGFEKTFTSIGKTSAKSFTDDSLISSFYEAIYKLTAFDSSDNESLFSNDIRLASQVLGGYYGYGGYGG